MAITNAPLRGRTRPGRGTSRSRGQAPVLPPRSAPDDVAAPWLALCPRGATVLRDPSPADVHATDPGTPLVLVTDRPWGRQRLRRTARQSGVMVQREILLLPSTSHTIVSVDEEAEAVRYFWRSVAMVPPGVTWPSPALTVALRLAEVLPWRWTGLALGGHLLIGIRP
jgi:hypothetical protein